METYFSNISKFDKDIVKREKEYDQHCNKNDMFKCTNFEDPDPGIHPASTGVALSCCQTLQLFLKKVEQICFFPTS